MVYESSGTGIFTLRDASNKSEAVDAIEKNGFVIEEKEGGTFEITFSQFKIYRAGKCFKSLAKYFDGKFDVQGDDVGDVWRLEFRGGRAFKREAIITYGEPVETDLDSPVWGKN